MKKYLFFLLAVCGLSACSDKSKIDREIEEVPITVELIRFDQEYMNTHEAQFQNLKKKFPLLFSPSFTDQDWLNKRNDSLFKVLYSEVETKFKDTKKLKADLKSLFQHIKFYFPEQKPGKVITLISEMDLEGRTIYTDSLSIISLDTYLGKSHRFYDVFENYTLIEFEPNQIIPNLTDSFLESKIPFPRERQFLNQMIYQGKMMYAKDVLIPNVPDYEKIGYTEDKWNWCVENESQMWIYFIENKLLYSSDSKLYPRFIQKAPFSKFYLDLDKESPGKVGVWIGWQIVRSYMKNNDVTLQELFAKDAKEIFDNSKYKPKK